MLLQRALPTSTGFTNEFFNGGSMRNLGVEAALSVRPLGESKVDWTSRGILTMNRSKVTSLPEGVDKFDITVAGFGTGLGAYRIEEGKSATQIVSTIDNFLRPLLISGPTRIPFLLVFFGVLGGLASLGLLGMFVGPVLLAVGFGLATEFPTRHHGSVGV